MANTAKTSTLTIFDRYKLQTDTKTDSHSRFPGWQNKDNLETEVKDNSIPETTIHKTNKIPKTRL
jgi:hypothetical protein